MATPENIFDMIYEEFGEDVFDPCPFERAEWDGLEIPWKGVTYINPPFKELSKWLAKGVCECKKGVTCVFLCPAETAARYWENIVYTHADQIRFLSGQIRFVGYEKNTGQRICLIVYRPESRMGGPPRTPRDISRDYLTDDELLGSPFVREHCPLLWFVTRWYTAFARPLLDEFIEWRKAWALVRLSMVELFEVRLRDVGSVFTRVMFGLYLQICSAEAYLLQENYSQSLTEDQSKVLASERLPLFRLLVRLRKQMGPHATGLSRICQPVTQFPEDKSEATQMVAENPWLLDAFHFFIVYREYEEEYYKKEKRINYMKNSFDRKFAQNVVFLN